MSVIVRTMQGRKYIHVRRIVNGKQLQKFYNIDNLSPKEIAVLKYEANTIDTKWAEMAQESFMDLFLQDGEFKYIKLMPPNKKNGWHLRLIKHETSKKSITISRSLDTNSFNKAFNDVFKVLTDSMHLRPRSTNVLVLKSVWMSKLHCDYLTAKSNYTMTSLKKHERSERATA